MIDLGEADLPAGWVEVRLDEIAEVRLGRQRSPKNHAGDQMRPYLRAANVGWDGLKLNDVKEMNFTDDEVETYRLLPGDIVLGEASGSASEVGKPALWNGQIEDCCFQNTLLRVRARTGIRPRYLLNFLRHEAIRGAFVQSSRGVGIHHLGAANLCGWRVPIPPTSEQDRIVDALEDRLSRLDAATGALVAADRRLLSLRTSLLMSLLNDPGSDSKGWTYSTIGELAIVGTGATPLKSRIDYYENGTIPWVTSSLLNDAIISRPDKFITGKALEETSTRVYPSGTILVAMYGEGKTRGMSAELGFPAATNQACAAIVLHDENQFRKPWIKLVLESQYHKLRRLSAGGVQPNLNLGLIRGIEIPLPPSAEQERIVSQLDSWSVGIQRLHSAAALLQIRGRQLRKLMTEQAFRGELVPQDPNKECTSVLLDRIRADREAHVSKPKRTVRRTRKRDAAVGVPPPPPPASSRVRPIAVQQELPL